MQYDSALVGKRIASGGDRRVYRYGTNQVIKFSSLAFLIGRKLHDKLVRDYEICHRHFPEFVLETIDATPPSARAHIEIQPYIAGVPLRKEHLVDTDTRKQFLQIHASLERMLAAGYPPIDLLGSGGVLAPCLSNIIVDENLRLRIIDATLFEGKSLGPIGTVFDALIPLALARQRSLVRRFLY